MGLLFVMAKEIKERILNEIKSKMLEDIIWLETMEARKDKEKCDKAEWRYGQINTKGIIYLGDTKTIDGIIYINIKEYVKSL